MIIVPRTLRKKGGIFLGRIGKLVYKSHIVIAIFSALMCVASLHAFQYDDRFFEDYIFDDYVTADEYNYILGKREFLMSDYGEAMVYLENIKGRKSGNSSELGDTDFMLGYCYYALEKDEVVMSKRILYGLKARSCFDKVAFNIKDLWLHAGWALELKPLAGFYILGLDKSITVKQLLNETYKARINGETDRLKKLDDLIYQYKAGQRWWWHHKANENPESDELTPGQGFDPKTEKALKGNVDMGNQTEDE